MNFFTKIAMLILVVLPIVTHAESKDPLLDKTKAMGEQLVTSTEDAAITAQIKALLALEPDIKSLDIHVTTMNHLVYLSGTVETRLQAKKAVEIAQSVSGVENVDDSKLNVSSSDNFLKDAFTTARVKVKIMKLANGDSISNNNELHVETTNGVVHIFGEVGERKDISTIEQAVRKMDGVKDVKVNIEVIKQ